MKVFTVRMLWVSVTTGGAITRNNSRPLPSVLLTTRKLIGHVKKETIELQSLELGRLAFSKPYES